MIYFDNAATGGFKPYSVIEGTTNAIRYLTANPGRSGHRLSLAGENLIYKTRCVLKDFFNADSITRVIFTKNCTEALNFCLLGTKQNGHIVTTIREHNSVLRPLEELKKQGALVSYAFPSKEKSLEDDILSKIKNNTYLVVASAVSNVTGEEIDLEYLGNEIKKINEKTIFIVDGAQAAGHTHINMQKCQIDALAIAGHKGLYGIMGSGALIFRKTIDILPCIFGGTGTESFSKTQPKTYPEALESGTISLPAVVSLLEGVSYVKRNVDMFGELLFEMSEILCNELKLFDKIRLYSSPNRAGIVAFSIDDYPSQEVANVLSSKYDIAVRGGLHCAPLIHKFLRTEEDGLIRVSLSPQNTKKEIANFLLAIKEILSN